MKKRARRSNENAMNIVADAVEGVSSPVVAALPNVPSLVRTVQRTRVQHNPQLIEPQHREDLVIPPSFTVTKKNKEFLLYNDGGKKRILIFTTTKNLEFLSTCNVWSADGTFRSVSQIFSQMYSIHGHSDGKVIPSVYALTPDRSRTTYCKILEFIKSKQPGLNPELLLVDFEIGFIKEFLKSFPDSDIGGCYFHFRQCNWRHVVLSGLAVRYSNDEQFSTAIKMLIALAFIPVKTVTRLFDSLILTRFFIDNQDDLNDYLTYFENTWIGKKQRSGSRRDPLFNLELWNCCEAVMNGLPRTSNGVEGWHHAFNVRVRIHHASTGKFIQALQVEQGSTDAYIVQSEAGINIGTVRRTRYVTKDEQIKAVVSQYKPTMSDRLRNI